ncbi:acyl-CoA dehydrogenase [Sphingobium sp.]|uniref:acyl-CoA dehydrogenase n=1 Tax=Sphingobium sp. TaxID=1912891 RepID=UPI0028BD4A6F|nr:acyl-CoA dehydrogenase [Sphingobium sp.]
MNDTSLSRRNIDFVLHDWLQIDKKADRETVDAILDLSERLAADQFLTHYKAADIEEPYLRDGRVHIHPAIGVALRQYAELGLFSASFPERHGGMELPYSVCAASFAIFAAANISTAAYPMLTVANARLIATFGQESQIETFAKPQIAGRWFGTMCLSEPQAGSSLDEVRTRAVFDQSDQLGERYRLSGNKMWISGGDQDVSENIVHLVLAKIPLADDSLPKGTAGLSLFIVPKILPDESRNDIRVAGLNHKMGYRGTANCLLNFGEEAGAVGWLIGEPGQGLRQMFMMMNEARISVGIGAAAIAGRSYQLATTYARERLQGRETGTGEREQVPIIRHADIKHMLLQQKSYVEGALALTLYCARLVDEASSDADSDALLGLLTPVAKTWSSEYGLSANDIAIQIHGGYGYTRDFDVEQLWRDNRLNPIHEGTTGIQAKDLLGRKILKDGEGIPILGRKIAATVGEAAAHSHFKEQAASLAEAWSSIEHAITTLSGFHQSKVFDNATPFLRLFGHVVVAWLWLEQALVTLRLDHLGDSRNDFVDGKRRACHFFYEFELPQALALLPAICAGSDVASGAAAEIF